MEQAEDFRVQENTTQTFRLYTRDRKSEKGKEGVCHIETAKTNENLRDAFFTMTQPPIKHKALLNVDLGEAVSWN